MKAPDIPPIDVSREIPNATNVGSHQYVSIPLTGNEIIEKSKIY
jgi:hypothetical protein